MIFSRFFIVLLSMLFLTSVVYADNHDTQNIVEKAKEINKKIKAVNYNIDTFKKVIYVYGIAQSEDEKDEIVKEAKEILDVKDVITSILLVEDLRIKKD